MQLSTRKIAVVGVLGGISIFLGATPLGFIPLGPAKATIMHIPVIIGAIVEGPVIGMLVGLIFGGFSMYQAAFMPTSPVQIVFLDPMVAIFPRILIALTSYYSYTRAEKWLKAAGRLDRLRSLPTAIAAAVGTLTNTVGVLSMIYFLHAAEFAAKISIGPAAIGKFIIFFIAIPNGIPEMAVAVIVVTAVVAALRKMPGIL